MGICARRPPVGPHRADDTVGHQRGCRARNTSVVDAETGQDLATVTLNQGRGMWDLVVASGQVLRYAFESESGELVEGTYALPEVVWPRL